MRHGHQQYLGGELVLVIDCSDLERSATFWCEALGYRRDGPAVGQYQGLLPPDGRGIQLLLQRTVALADRGCRETGLVTAPGMSSAVAGFRFPREVISVAVRWYLRYGLPYRDAGELLAERGITVDHVTVCRWVQRFTPELIEAARPGRHAPGARWFAGETYLKAAGKWTYLYRAAGQHGQVIDVLLSARRDVAAARHFFTRALRAGTIPVEVSTDRADVYPRVLDELIPAGHAFVPNLRRGHYDIATDVYRPSVAAP